MKTHLEYGNELAKCKCPRCGYQLDMVQQGANTWAVECLNGDGTNEGDGPECGYMAIASSMDDAYRKYMLELLRNQL